MSVKQRKIRALLTQSALTHLVTMNVNVTQVSMVTGKNNAKVIFLLTYTYNCTISKYENKLIATSNISFRFQTWTIK